MKGEKLRERSPCKCPEAERSIVDERRGEEREARFCRAL